MQSFPFKILQRFEAGGLCDVHLAADQRSGELVVLKTLAARYRSVAGAREKMLAEGELLRLIKYPNVVECLQMGEHQGVPFIVLQYIPGVDLHHLIQACVQRGQSIDLQVTVYVVIELLKALAHIHRFGDRQGQNLGLVHRDIKPANLMLGFDGSVRLIDFGIAVAADLDELKQNFLEGTLAYLSPEQISEPDKVNSLSDIYSAGALLYEISTLSPPYEMLDGDEKKVLKRIVNGQLLAPRKRVRGYDKRLEKIVLKAMARRPHKRFPKAEHMSVALSELRESESAGRQQLITVLKSFFSQHKVRIDNMRMQARLQAGH